MTDTAHRLAAAQLAALQHATNGAIEVVAEADDDADDDVFVISLNTSGIPRGPGVRVRARERFRITVPAAFPFQPPSVRATHRRWRNSPHVHWGDLLCLYAAPSVEWDPGEGMRGFVERLLSWIERAAAGELDPEGHPLHPPVTYQWARAGQLVVHPDLGNRVPWKNAALHAAAADTDTRSSALVTFYGWCVQDGDRIELREWLTLPQAVARIVADDTNERVDEAGRRCFLVTTLLLNTELGWEYPDTARALAERVATSGYSGDQLLLELVRTAALNRVLARRPDATQTHDPVILVVGTPSRRLTGTARLAHLFAWELDELGTRVTGLLRANDMLSLASLDTEIGQLGREWLTIADVAWMQVHELRPEVTHRRDEQTPAAWLHGKQILVLGCGALGAPIAEHCVRAGAHRITVLDNGTVTPGILVRQPYTYNDIGHRKAIALTARLNTLTSTPTVTARVANAVTTLLEPSFDPTGYDLIIDATADVATRTALERVRSPRRTDWPPIATMIIGHRAERGVICLSRPGATGAGHDLLRRLAVAVHTTERSRWGDVAEDLFPDPPRTALFSPEPGCSAPTFVGSAAQVSALAAQLLLHACDLLADHADAPMTAAAVRVGASSTSGPATAAARVDPQHSASCTLSWSNDLVCTEVGNGFEVRISAGALAEMRAETRRAHRLHGPEVETGGMLLGAVDEALAVIHVDIATGPPPDSRLSARHFEHGLVGTQDAVDHHRARTGRRTGYIGLWHSHPGGPARPSPTDMASLATLTTGRDAGRWALMLIVAGDAPIWQGWRDHTGTPAVYARAVHRDTCTTTNAAEPGDGTGGGPPNLPPGQCFPGGYPRPTPSTATARPIATSWRPPWRRRRRALR